MPPVTPEGVLLQRIADRLDALFELLQGQATTDKTTEPAGDSRVEVRDADTPAGSRRRTTRKK